MKATLMGIDNIEEIQTARVCGYDIPKPVFRPSEEIFFLVDAMEVVYLDGEKNIALQLNGHSYLLKYEKELYNELTAMLE